MDDESGARAMYRHRADVVAEDVGNGPHVVFLHGALMDRTMFAPQVAALADDYRIVTYDLRARTDNWGGPYDLWHLAGDCLALLDALDVESCVLAGMSMGGSVAQRVALQQPDRVDGLVLIDGQALPDPDEDRRQYREMIERARGSDRPPADLVEAASWILFGHQAHDERPGLIETWTNRWRTYPADAVYHEIDSFLGRENLLDRMPEIRVPALAIHGENDRSIDIERARRTVEALPDARLEPIPDAGHASNLERPGPVNDALQEFLGSVY